jgi:hypothetical protein
MLEVGHEFAATALGISCILSTAILQLHNVELILANQLNFELERYSVL